MNRKEVMNGYGLDGVLVNAVFKGAGAADPTIPSNTEANKQTNAAASATRTGVGVYECVFAAGSVPPRVTQVIPHVEGAALQAFVTTQYAAATRKVVISVFTAAGVAAELTNLTAFLKLLLVGQDSTA